MEWVVPVGVVPVAWGQVPILATHSGRVLHGVPGLQRQVASQWPASGQSAANQQQPGPGWCRPMTILDRRPQISYRTSWFLVGS